MVLLYPGTICGGFEKKTKNLQPEIKKNKKFSDNGIFCFLSIYDKKGSYCLRLKELEKMEIKSGWTFFSLFCYLCYDDDYDCVCVCMLGLKSKNRKGIYAARLFFPFFPQFFPFEIGVRQEISFVENVAICLCVVIGNLVSFAIRCVCVWVGRQ